MIPQDFALAKKAFYLPLAPNVEGREQQPVPRFRGFDSRDEAKLANLVPIPNATAQSISATCVGNPKSSLQRRRNCLKLGKSHLAAVLLEYLLGGKVCEIYGACVASEVIARFDRHAPDRNFGVNT